MQATFTPHGFAKQIRGDPEVFAPLVRFTSKWGPQVWLSLREIAYCHEALQRR